jgi:hypothetical protein
VVIREGRDEMSLIRIDDSGQEITREFLRERGMHGARTAALALQAEDENGPELARRAIADLVEASSWTDSATPTCSRSRIASGRCSAPG